MPLQHETLACVHATDARQRHACGSTGCTQLVALGCGDAHEQFMILTITQGMFQRWHAITGRQLARMCMHGNAR
jgi:hypothetical protein